MFENYSQILIDNNSNLTILERAKTDYIISYISIIIITLGLTCNTTAFLIFRFNMKMKKIPSMVILSFVCITDTLSLFTWNINHFVFTNFGFEIENLNIYNCKIFLFMQYFSLQSSGLLLSMVSIDRYIFVSKLPNSFLSKLPFGTLKTATCWSILIITIVGLLNSYLLIFDRKYLIKYVECYILSNGFQINIIWEKVHSVVYSILPFILMIIFNSLLIKRTFGLKSKNTNQKDKNRRKSLTFSLLFITISFLIMTLPTQICYSFFLSDFLYDETLNNILVLLDCLSFFNHSSLFFSCFITNRKFREIVIEKFSIISGSNHKKNNQKYPTRIISMNALRTVKF
jgi:hypothetical protein